MKRLFVASFIVVLVVSSGALGAMGDIPAQSQIWGVHGHSTAFMTGGTGSAHAGVFNAVLKSQNLSTAEGAKASQIAGTVVLQDAKADSHGASLVGVDQDMLVDGGATDPSLGQVQSVQAYDGVAQVEGVHVVGEQTLVKDVGGTATADGTNVAAVGMGQEASSNSTLNAEQWVLIVGGQDSNITGTSPASQGMVGATSEAIVMQTQASE